MCCTSGTAAANFHPAVVEAHHARVPLLVCTADRPPELRDAGAGQTIDQDRLFGGAARWFYDPGPPERRSRRAGAAWRSLAARAVAETLGPPAGPVHLNLPFREPLVPTGAPLVDAPGRADGAPVDRRRRRAARAADPTTSSALAALVRAHPTRLARRGLGRAGVDPATATRFARGGRAGRVLADPLSGLRDGPHAVSTYEALLRATRFADAHRPDLVVRVGAPLTSKVATAWLDADVPQVLVDPDDALARSAARRARARRGRRRARCSLRVADALGAGAERRVAVARRRGSTPSARPRAAIDARARRDRRSRARARVARDVAAAFPTAARSWSRRACPCARSSGAWRRARGLRVAREPRRERHRRVRVDGRRRRGGASATRRADGRRCAATSASCTTRTGCSARRAGPATVVVVLDNDGGGIFSYLPPAELPEFEALFGTPHGLDLVDVARAHGAVAERIDDVDQAREPRSTPTPAAATRRAGARRSRRPVAERRAPPRAVGRGRKGRTRLNRHPRQQPASDAHERARASARASPGSRPTRRRDRSRRRCPRPRAAGRGGLRSAPPRSATTNSPSPSRVDPPERPRVATAWRRLRAAAIAASAASARGARRPRAWGAARARGRARRRRVAERRGDRGREVGDAVSATGAGPSALDVVARGRQRAARPRRRRAGARGVLHRAHERRSRVDTGAGHRPRRRRPGRPGARAARASRRRSRRRRRRCSRAGRAQELEHRRRSNGAFGLDDDLACEHDLLERAGPMSASAASTIASHSSSR